MRRWFAVLAFALVLTGRTATAAPQPDENARPDSVVRANARRTPASETSSGSSAADAPASPPALAPPPAGAAALPARDYLAQARAGYTSVNRSYNRTRVLLRFVEPLVSFVISLLLLFTGLSRRFRDIAHGLGHTLYVRVLVYFGLYLLATFLLSLPLDWYAEFALEHQYGLSSETLGGWLGDSLKALVFNIVSFGVVPLGAIVWGAVERWPRGWWWRLACATLPVAAVMVLLQPIVFEPMFNTFTPLHDAALRDRILALGARAGVPARKVLEVDMSKRTNKVNAYVSGFGASQRIVLWDTTLKTLQPDEILVVMGHEMGHYVLDHVWVFLGGMSVAAFLALFLTARIGGALIGRFGPAWGAEGLSDLAAFPAYVLALGIVSMLMAPAFNAVSRETEHQADVFALEITHDNDAACRAFLKLAHDNRSDPEPSRWVRLLFADHPPLGERIRFAMTYRPWESGQPNRYFHPHS